MSFSAEDVLVEGLGFDLIQESIIFVYNRDSLT